MKRTFLRGLLAVAIGALAFAGYTQYANYRAQLRGENARLAAIVEEKFADIKIPPGSFVVYQELAASRACKIANLRRLFASNEDTAKLCDAVLRSVESKGMASYYDRSA